MRILYLIFVFLFVFALLYFILSLFGLLFIQPYWKIISDPQWFIGYTLFVGTWAPIIVVNEEHERLEAKDATITI
jgi:hypothetical protein